MPQDRAHIPYPPLGPPGRAGSEVDSDEARAAAVGGTYFLGRYRVVDEIGVGGMASVHLARMDGPGGFQKWVAIKRIHPHLVEDETFVAHVPRRGARRGAHLAPERRDRLRARQARGHVLDRDGVPPRRAAARGHAPHRRDGAAHAARDRVPRDRRRRRGAARRARAARQERREAPARPPRRHAAQPLRHVRRRPPRSSTSASRSSARAWPTRAPARSRASSRTCRRSRCAASRSTVAPTSSRSASCSGS